LRFDPAAVDAPGRLRNRHVAVNVGQVGYAQRFVFVRLRCGRDVNAGAAVTLIVGKARSLAARRRAKRDEPDAAEVGGEAVPADGEADRGGMAHGVLTDRGATDSGAPHAGPADRRATNRGAGDGGAAGKGSSAGAADGGGAAAVRAAARGGGMGRAAARGGGLGRAGRVVLAAPAGGLPGRLRGRADVLTTLSALVWAPDGQARVLAGAGGTGKTAIALWVAREAARRGVPVWWVAAADERSVTVSLLDLAADLGAQPAEVAQAGAGQRDAADLLWRYLEQRAPWLLVFDGADNPAALAGPGWLRSTQGGLIVITSRNTDGRAWGRHAELHPVEPLGPAEGGRVLTDLAPRAGSAAQAAALSARLGGLPLAVRHAGCLLATAAVGRGRAGTDGAGEAIAGYASALDERGGTAGGDVVAGTRELALEALAAGGRPRARALLRVLCCLAPATVIPAAMLDMDVLGRACGGDAELAKKGLRALSQVGLVDSQDAGVTVHRLVCESSRVYTGEAAARAGGIAVAMLAAAAARLDARADWPAWVALQPHVSAVYGYLGGALGADSLAALTGVAAATALAFSRAGRTAAAAELATEALRHARRLGAGHEAVLGLCDAVALGTGYRLARLLARQGQYEAAERSLRELLDAQQRTLGPDHPSTLTARHEFGLVLAQRGQYARAAREFADLLSTRARVLGPEHRDTRFTRRWLTHVARAAGTVRSG
jgi:hypothetical protein